MELCKDLVKKDDCQVVVVQEEMQQLLYDAVYEVLTRVNLVSLLRQCRWVCKDWQKLIFCDTQFQKKHIQNTPSLGPGCFVYDYLMRFIKFAPYMDNHHEHKSPIVSSPFLDFLPMSANDTLIACASQFGSLLCCVTKQESSRIPSYYICKPATREWRKIPNPKTSLASFHKVHIGMAVTQSYPQLQFKVLRLCRSETGFGLHCEVFDSINWTWKRKQFIKSTKYLELIQQKYAIFLNGGFHWTTHSYSIFAYYVDQEKWTLLEFSRDILGKESPYIVINCDGKLGVIFYNKEWMEVWILESYLTTEPFWKRKFRNDVRWAWENNPGNMRMPLLVGMWSSDTVVMVSLDEIVWFNCVNDTKTIVPCTSTSRIFGMFRPEFSYL